LRIERNCSEILETQFF